MANTNGANWPKNFTSVQTDNTLGLPNNAEKGGSIIWTQPNPKTNGNWNKILFSSAMSLIRGRNGQKFQSYSKTEGMNTPSKIGSNHSSQKNKNCTPTSKKKLNSLTSSTKNMIITSPNWDQTQSIAKPALKLPNKKFKCLQQLLLARETSWARKFFKFSGPKITHKL